MPWTQEDYPSSMKNLDKCVRDKAIEIANALLKEGYEDGRAIPIAIEKAKEWADSDSSSSEKHHVIPHDGKWAIKKENSKRVSQTFDTKQDAIDRAKEIAQNQGSSVVIHTLDETIERTLKP